MISTSECFHTQLQMILQIAVRFSREPLRYSMLLLNILGKMIRTLQGATAFNASDHSLLVMLLKLKVFVISAYPQDGVLGGQLTTEKLKHHGRNGRILKELQYN